MPSTQISLCIYFVYQVNSTWRHLRIQQVHTAVQCLMQGAYSILQCISYTSCNTIPLRKRALCKKRRLRFTEITNSFYCRMRPFASKNPIDWTNVPARYQYQYCRRHVTHSNNNRCLGYLGCIWYVRSTRCPCPFVILAWNCCACSIYTAVGSLG